MTHPRGQRRHPRLPRGSQQEGTQSSTSEAHHRWKLKKKKKKTKKKKAGENPGRGRKQTANTAKKETVSRKTLMSTSRDESGFYSDACLTLTTHLLTHGLNTKPGRWLHDEVYYTFFFTLCAFLYGLFSFLLKILLFGLYAETAVSRRQTQLDSRSRVRQSSQSEQ